MELDALEDCQVRSMKFAHMHLMSNVAEGGRVNDLHQRCAALCNVEFENSV